MAVQALVALINLAFIGNFLHCRFYFNSQMAKAQNVNACDISNYHYVLDLLICLSNGNMKEN